MPLAYTRPFHPYDFDSSAPAVFWLSHMIEQLRQEEVYRTAHRNALTLIHDPTLTVVLTVARAGAECEDHLSQEPTLFVTLEGELAIESAADGEVIHLPSGCAGALDHDVRHKLSATSDCAYMMVLGSHDAAATEPTAARQAPSAEHDSQEVEGLVHELVHSIEAAPASTRDELGTYATDLLVADIASARSQAEELQRSHRLPPLNVAGGVFFLALVGLFFLFFLPPVAIICISLAIVLAVGGILWSLAWRGARVGQRLLGFHGSPAQRS